MVQEKQEQLFVDPLKPTGKNRSGIRMYIKSINQAARTFSPKRRHRLPVGRKKGGDEEKKEKLVEVPVEQDISTNEEQTRKELPNQERQRNDFVISDSNSLLATSTDLEVEQKSALVVENAKCGIGSEVLADVNSLTKRRSRSLPSADKGNNLVIPPSPTHSENTAIYICNSMNNNTRGKEAVVPKSPDPASRLRWKRGSSMKRLFLKNSLTKLQEKLRTFSPKNFAKERNQAEQRSPPSPTADTPSTKEFFATNDSNESESQDAATSYSTSHSEDASSNSSSSNVASQLIESFSSGRSSIDDRSSSVSSGVLATNVPVDIGLLCSPFDVTMTGPMMLLQQKIGMMESDEIATVVTSSDDSKLKNSPSLLSTTLPLVRSIDEKPPSGKICRLFVRQASSESGSIAQYQIEILPPLDEKDQTTSEYELLNGLTQSCSSSADSSTNSSNFKRTPSSFGGGERFLQRRDNTELSDAFTDIPGVSSALSAKETMLLLSDTSESPTIQCSLSLDRKEFECGVKSRRKDMGTKDFRRSATLGTDECSDAFTDGSGTCTTDDSDAFTDISSVRSKKYRAPPDTTIIDTATSNLEPALEVKLIGSTGSNVSTSQPPKERVALPTNISFEEAPRDRNPKDEISEAFTKHSGGDWTAEFSFWSVDSLRVLSTASSAQYAQYHQKFSAATVPVMMLSGEAVLSGEMDGETSRNNNVGPSHDPHTEVEVDLYGIREQTVY